MAVRDIFKVSRKTFINPTAWIGYDTLKYQTRTIWTVLSTMFTPAKPTRVETFDEAVKRLGLTEAEIDSTAASYRRYAGSFFVLAIISFAYAFFLLFHYGTFSGWLLGIAVTGLFGSQAFKYDFWSYQMRQRKLGVTFDEWKAIYLGGKGSST